MPSYGAGEQVRAKPLIIDWDTRDAAELRRNTKTLIRFLKHCSRDENGLLYWNGPFSNAGYGKFCHKYRTVSAHRMSYALLVDIVPAPVCVLHHNDEPACVDPSILYLGTDKDNARDKMLRGRNNHPVGEAWVGSKLTRAAVLDIRNRYGRGLAMQKELAREYGLDRSTISYVVSRKTWGHIA